MLPDQETEVALVLDLHLVRVLRNLPLQRGGQGLPRLWVVPGILEILIRLEPVKERCAYPRMPRESRTIDVISVFHTGCKPPELDLHDLREVGPIIIVIKPYDREPSPEIGEAVPNIAAHRAEVRPDRAREPSVRNAEHQRSVRYGASGPAAISRNRVCAIPRFTLSSAAYPACSSASRWISSTSRFRRSMVSSRGYFCLSASITRPPARTWTFARANLFLRSLRCRSKSLTEGER